MHWLGEDAHVISMDDVYGGTRRLFSQVFSQAARSFTYVDLSDPSAFEAHVQPNTRAIWIESPTNPLMKLVDIEAIVERAHSLGLKVIVDNTFMSPYFQSPLALERIWWFIHAPSISADIVMS